MRYSSVLILLNVQRLWNTMADQHRSLLQGFLEEIHVLKALMSWRSITRVEVQHFLLTSKRIKLFNNVVKCVRILPWGDHLNNRTDVAQAVAVRLAWLEEIDLDRLNNPASRSFLAFLSIFKLKDKVKDLKTLRKHSLKYLSQLVSFAGSRKQCAFCIHFSNYASNRPYINFTIVRLWKQYFRCTIP